MIDFAGPENEGKNVVSANKIAAILKIKQVFV